MEKTPLAKEHLQIENSQASEHMVGGKQGSLLERDRELFRPANVWPETPCLSRISQGFYNGKKNVWICGNERMSHNYKCMYKFRISETKLSYGEQTGQVCSL